MIRRQACKFELKTNGAQSRAMRRHAGACRFVFNRALALQKELHSQGLKNLGYAGLCAELTQWKREAGCTWLNEAPSQSLQQALKDLDRAYTNFFAGRAKFPQFKRRGRHEAFRFPQGVKLDQANSRAFLPKLGWICYRNSREVPGEIENVTLTEALGKWQISIQTEREVAQPIPAATAAVGIDVGIARFATLSDGSFLAPQNSFRQHERKLARYQRALSRKVKFSSNWKKTKARVQRLHARIANIRRDYLHKATNTISQNHAVVFVESLQVRNMSKSAAGTIEAPGRNVRAKSGLNKAILDQGWAEFRRQLEYKMAWAGGQLIAVPPQYTSQTCPCCGHVAADNRRTQAKFACTACGFEENADVVGAMNIKAAGLAVLACGEAALSGTSMKQEPTEEASHAIA